MKRNHSTYLVATGCVWKYHLTFLALSKQQPLRFQLRVQTSFKATKVIHER